MYDSDVTSVEAELHRAIEQSDVAAVRMALSAGASPDSSESGMPSVFIAAKIGQPEILRLILEAGANPNAQVNQKNVKDADPKTALAAACSAGNIECANVLLYYGANPNHARPGGPSAADFLIRCERFRRPDQDWHVDVSTIQAATRLLERMIDMGLKIETPYKSLLYDLAVYRAPAPMVRLVLARGACPHRVHKSTGNSPFSFVCRSGRMTQLKAMLEFGVEINTPLAERDDKYPLHYCSDMQIYKLLIDNGADVELNDRWGKTPLAATLEKYPYENFSAEKIAMLLKAGARVDAVDGNGFSVMHIIKHRKLNELLALIAARDARQAVSSVMAAATRVRSSRKTA